MKHIPSMDMNKTKMNKGKHMYDDLFGFDIHMVF